MSYTAFTRIRTCALAIVAVLFIGGQASAQPQGGPSVTVANTPLPVTVTNQAIPGTPVAFNLGSPFSVPAGQRLVIEYVSGECNFPAAAGFEVTTGGVPITYLIALPSGIVAGLNWQFGQLVKVYADPGTSVVLISLAECHIAVSGLLVNTP